MRTESLPTTIVRRAWIPFGWLLYVPVALLLWVGSGWALPVALRPLTARVQGLVTIFLGIFIEALPFVVAGVLISSLLGLLITDRIIQRLMPKRALPAALVGAALGLALPVCECGNVPTTRWLLHKGVPLPFAIAFLLAAPVINPVVIASTYVAFNGDWLIVGGRIGLTLLIAVGVAIILGRLPEHATLLAPALGHTDASAQLHHNHEHQGDAHHQRSLDAILSHSAEELLDMSRWLILGALLAATLQTFVPQSALLGSGGGPIVSVLVMMALALLLSVCSTVDAFLALALSGVFGPGALLTFLVYGPMIDIKSGLMFLTTLSPRAIGLIFALVTPLVFLAGVAVSLLVR
jgi:uncharacterized membrane protein YraQ (UPF0718 family)